MESLRDIFKVHIAFTQLTGKLLFENAHSKNAVIANQSAYVVWQSPG